MRPDKVRVPKKYAPIAQLVERIHGKDEVPGSNPGWGSMISLKNSVRNPGIFICSKVK
jgi:hypothetical protein